MKSRASITFAAALAAALAAGSFAVTVNAQEYDHQPYNFGYGHQEFRGFVPGSIVVSGTVYVGKAGTVTPGEILPFGCLNTGAGHEPESRHRECAGPSRRRGERREHRAGNGDLRLCER